MHYSVKIGPYEFRRSKTIKKDFPQFVGGTKVESTINFFAMNLTMTSRRQPRHWIDNQKIFI